MRRLIALLIVLAIVFGAPYAAALLNRLMGPWSAEAVEADGSRTHMQFGQDLPRPDWGAGLSRRARRAGEQDRLGARAVRLPCA